MVRTVRNENEDPDCLLGFSFCFGGMVISVHLNSAVRSTNSRPSAPSAYSTCWAAPPFPDQRIFCQSCRYSSPITHHTSPITHHQEYFQTLLFPLNLPISSIRRLLNQDYVNPHHQPSQIHIDQHRPVEIGRASCRERV